MPTVFMKCTLFYEWIKNNQIISHKRYLSYLENSLWNIYLVFVLTHVVPTRASSDGVCHYIEESVGFDQLNDNHTISHTENKHLELLF